MARKISTRLPAALYREVRDHAAAHSMSLSEAIRDLLGIAVGMDADQRGRLEGVVAGHREVLRRMHEGD